VLYVGLAAFAIGTGFLIMSYFGSGSQPEAAIDANINRFMPIAMLGAIAVAVSGSWIMLEEETAGVITAIVGGLLMFAPSVFPQMGGPTGDVSARVLNAISQVGIPILGGGVFLILYDMGSRVRTRAREGARADKLKLGQGLKEERDYQNVFLGKCWQLPYCRKFIREQCPIYHAKTTCWKERVGCMCEEAIIGNAMKGKNEEPQDPDLVASGKVVATGPKLTKEQLLSGKYIPQNNRLTATMPPVRDLQRAPQAPVQGGDARMDDRGSGGVSADARTAGPGDEEPLAGGRALGAFGHLRCFAHLRPRWLHSVPRDCAPCGRHHGLCVRSAVH
jgi:hypothetical protein